jgi:phospholipid/cholesterol/gamma-HCH transport system substrate-binding protein
MRGRGAGIAGNPVLIGAATVLVVIVAVFLSYNANQGLPFVPSYALKAELPSAANLVRGNDVRIGGTRVGSVDSIDVEQRDDGTSIAVVGLKLERSVAPLPKDSTIIVRPRSALGLKYVDLTRGTAEEGFDDGATMPLSAATPAPVEFDEVLNMFDDETRSAAQQNLRGFGDALAGRGSSLNMAIGALAPLLRDLVPVVDNLTSRRTDLPRFVAELSDAARIVAPAAEQQAALFVALDRTFAALDRVTPFIQESITEGPATLDAGIAGFPRQRPFLANTEGLFRELRPGARALRAAAPDLADAIDVGTPTLRRLPAFNRRLAALLQEVERFSEDPLVPQGLRALTKTMNELNPTLQFLAPAQTTCNYLTLWFRNIASLLSEGDANGTWQRFIIVAAPSGPNNEGGPSSAPANGPTLENHLHTNPYPNTAAPGQPRECEAGNEPYPQGTTVTTNPAGRQQAATEGKP